jgi:hypothetical protein
MSIKLRPDGTVEADTPEELVAYQRHFSKNGHAKPAKRMAQSGLGDDDGMLPEAATKLVKLLWTRPQGMETRDIAKAFGLDHAKGIGGSVTSLTAWGRRRDLKKKQLLVKTRRVDGSGHTSRILSLSDFFRKMIMEGRVPGMTLDS